MNVIDAQMKKDIQHPIQRALVVYKMREYLMCFSPDYVDVP
jgi:hypothetical protein